MELTMQTEDVDGWIVATVHGDIDLTTAPRLREQVVEIVLGGRPRVVIDLNGVDFVDSTGLGVLVGLLKRSRTHGGDLRLVSTRTSLRKVLELTSLDLALPPFDNVGAAIAADGAGG
jgi:anti-sigma B factor antagonist